MRFSSSNKIIHLLFSEHSRIESKNSLSLLSTHFFLWQHWLHLSNHFGTRVYIYMFSFQGFRRNMKEKTKSQTAICWTWWSYLSDFHRSPRITQSHRIIDLGKDLWKSSSTIPHSKDCQLDQVTWGHLYSVLNMSKEEDFKISLGTLKLKTSFSYVFILCISNHAHFLLPFCWIPLRRAWLHLLCPLPHQTLSTCLHMRELSGYLIILGHFSGLTTVYPCFS